MQGELGKFRVLGLRQGELGKFGGFGFWVKAGGFREV